MAAREIALISVAIDLGAGRRGVDMGPSAIRVAGLGEVLLGLGFRVREFGTVHSPEPEEMDFGEARHRYRREIAQVTSRTAELVRQALEEGCFPLILGGDHSLSIGSVAGVSRFHRERSGAGIGVIWSDAHADMNLPETSPSGNIHGMSLAILTGQGGPPEMSGLAGVVPAVDPRHVSILGAREVDPAEREIVKRSGVRAFTMTEVDERGMAPCVDEALERATAGTAGFHLSFDLDGIDPMTAPGVGTPVPGGFSYREAHLLCEKAARTGAMVSLEMVELNPVLDVQNRTGRLAVGLLASALGKTIL